MKKSYKLKLNKSVNQYINKNFKIGDEKEREKKNSKIKEVASKRNFSENPSNRKFHQVVNVMSHSYFDLMMMMMLMPLSIILYKRVLPPVPLKAFFCSLFVLLEISVPTSLQIRSRLCLSASAEGPTGRDESGHNTHY